MIRSIQSKLPGICLDSPRIRLQGRGLLRRLPASAIHHGAFPPKRRDWWIGLACVNSFGRAAALWSVLGCPWTQRLVLLPPTSWIHWYRRDVHQKELGNSNYNIYYIIFLILYYNNLYYISYNVYIFPSLETQKNTNETTFLYPLFSFSVYSPSASWEQQTASLLGVTGSPHCTAPGAAAQTAVVHGSACRFHRCLLARP